MKSTALRLVAVLALLGAGGGLYWQQQQLRRTREENTQLRAGAGELESLREEVTRLRQTQIDPAELQRLRQGQAELLRLRGETSQLRRQLKEEQQPKRTAPAKESPPASAATETAAPPVETFTANARASLGLKQTLITGGWMIPPGGKRGIVLVEPALSGDGGQPGQVVIQTKFVELPEDVLSKTGLDGLKFEGKESSSQAVLDAEQSQALINSLKETQGVNILSAPTISTQDGRQAEMKLGGTRTVNGVTFEVGPSVDVLPRLSPDGTSIDLTVTAQLRYQTPAPR